MAVTTAVEMLSMDEKKNSVKFFTDNKDAYFDNLYVKKAAVPLACKGIRVTVEFLT